MSDALVRNIWNLCHILRGDGITFYQYVSELSYLLFLKIAQESDTESLIPHGCRWADLEKHGVDGLLGFYQEMLTHLGAAAENDVVRAVYAFPTTVFSHSENLNAVIDGISALDWHTVGGDHFGEIYSGLIDKSAQDARSAAGQYFTPRPLVDTIVRSIKPKLGELIQDPAAGSGGFLVSADSFLRSQYSSSEYQANPPRYQGVEIEKNTRRICLMNTFLHKLDAEIVFGDTLTEDASALEPPDVIVANPPFGAKAGSKRALRADLPYPQTNKQLAFLQHIYTGLKEGGRAAVVMPDNILFEQGIGKIVRSELMNNCDLHTILRLPAGIFSSVGVKTNVLFLTKLREKKAGTRATWFFDMRTNMPRFGKTTPLQCKFFEEFEQCFGDDPYGRSARHDDGTLGRFRCFTRRDITTRNDNLDITWLRPDTTNQEEERSGPEDIAAFILGHLRAAVAEVESIVDEFQRPENGKP